MSTRRSTVTPVGALCPCPDALAGYYTSELHYDDINVLRLGRGEVQVIEGGSTKTETRTFAYGTAEPELVFSVTDVSDPENPVPFGYVADNRLWGIHGLALMDDFAFVTVWNNHSVVAIDISDRANPVIIGEVIDNTRLQSPLDCARVGEHLFVCAPGENRLAVVNVGNPWSPYVVTAIQHAAMQEPASMAIAGNYAYLTCDLKVVIVDISDPAAPFVVGWTSDALVDELRGYIDPGNFFQVTSDGTRAFVFYRRPNQLVALDVSDKTSPTLIGSLELDNPGQTNIIHCRDRVYFGTQSEGIVCVDVSRQGAMKVVSTFYDDVVDGADAIALASDRRHLWVVADAKALNEPGDILTQPNTISALAMK